MKFVKRNKLELSDTLVSDLFIINNMLSLQGEDIKLYIYMLFLSKTEKEMDIATLAKKIGVKEQEINFSLDRLQAEELITKTTQGLYINDLKEAEVNKSYIPKIEPRKSKEKTEQERKRIAAATAINESFFQGVMSLRMVY